MISLHNSDNLLLLRKPAGIASSSGKIRSIFDILHSQSAEDVLQKSYISVQAYRSLYSIDLTQEGSIYSQEKDFDPKLFPETLSLNRLDTPTSGYMLFANNIEQKDLFLQQQKEHIYQKYYLARVAGDIRYRCDKHPDGICNYPIMHHRTLDDRMVCLQGSKNRGRGEPHHVQSKIEFLSFDEQTQSSSIRVMITKGIRHQIRVHLSTLGYPLLGDPIYGAPGKKTGTLALTSIGIKKI